MKPTCSYSGEERRNPRPTQGDYLALKYLAELLKRNVQQLPPERISVLDCGCGEKPYFPFFESRSSFYVGIDLTRSKYVDVVGDVERLPFNDLSFDAVLCTQVLEHVLSPQALIHEIYRVLKDGSFLFLSTHGVWPVHDFPSDFWRWTDSGLEQMLRGFSTVKIYECGGSIASLFQIMNLYLPPEIGKIRPFISFCLNKTGEHLDNTFRNKMKGRIKLHVNYLAVAKK